jgi:hypothetical protein
MRRIALLLIGAPLALLAAGAGPEGPSADVEANLRFLRELREEDSVRYRRLDRNFDRFQAMPSEQQDRLRQLDRQLTEADAETRDRLLRVMGEYAAWLARLPEADRQRVIAAASSEERVQVVREIKERQWVESQPPARLAEWRAANEELRRRLAERWRQEEQAHSDDWAEAKHLEAMERERPMGPRGLDGFREDLSAFIQKRLVPMLSADELKQLQAAEAMRRWNMQGYFTTVVKLSDRHPVLAPDARYLSGKGLPEDYRKALDSAPDTVATHTEIKNLTALEGKPEFAANVARLVRLWNAPVKQQLGPVSAKEISPAVEEFVAKKLTDEDRARLKKDEGRWPEYVQTLHKVARERKLAVPDLDLPGDPAMWDGVRNRPAPSLPDPPVWALARFAAEYNQKNPSNRLSLEKPGEREDLKRKYYEAHPEALRRPTTMPPGRNFGKPR